MDCLRCINVPQFQRIVLQTMEDWLDNINLQVVLQKFSLQISLSWLSLCRTQSADKGQEPELLSTDMLREIQRQKWEQEQEEMLAEQPTVHYSNVQFDGKLSRLSIAGTFLHVSNVHTPVHHVYQVHFIYKLSARWLILKLSTFAKHYLHVNL